MDFHRAVKRDEAKLRHSEQLMYIYFGSNGYDSHKAALRMARKWIRVAKKLRRQHMNDLEELGVFAPEHQPGYTLKRC